MIQVEQATGQQYACPSHCTKNMILPILDSDDFFGQCTDRGSTLPSLRWQMATYRWRTATLCNTFLREASISHPAEGRRV